MASLVDHEAVLVDFEAFLVEDGRQSHGTEFLTRKLAELRAQHRIHESAEAAVLRHFSGHLADTFFGLLPVPATSAPLVSDDPTASEAMSDGAAIPSPSREASCQTQPPPSPGSQRTPGSRTAARPTQSRVAAAAT